MAWNWPIQNVKSMASNLLDVNEWNPQPNMSKPRTIWPWVVAIAVMLPVLYVLSFGPACWIVSRVSALHIPIMRLYTPIGVIAQKYPDWTANAIYSYARLGMPYDQTVSVPASFRGKVDFVIANDIALFMEPVP